MCWHLLNFSHQFVEAAEKAIQGQAVLEIRHLGTGRVACWEYNIHIWRLEGMHEHFCPALGFL